MVIYLLKNKNNTKEIYIGKTKNLRNRIYAHKSCAIRKINRPIYNWINEIGFENLIIETELECSESQADLYEKETIRKYENLGYKVLNEQLTKKYCPIENFDNKFIHKKEVWDLYNNSTLSRKEIIRLFNISDSLLSKIIQENKGSNRKNKLYGHYEEIQSDIIKGIPIREIARKYEVSKNSISNINKGITSYNPNLSYPLNKEVRESIVKEYQFKKKVQSERHMKV